MITLDEQIVRTPLPEHLRRSILEAVTSVALTESEWNARIHSWWYDDRKKVQWYTFWVAALVLLLTIVFGLVQSVSGVVQAWAAVRSMPP